MSHFSLFCLNQMHWQTTYLDIFYVCAQKCDIVEYKFSSYYAFAFFLQFVLVQ